MQVLDLPGTYSLYPKSADEQVTYEVLLNPENADRPELIVVIADASNLKRNLLFCSQIMDLKIPVVIALTMGDIARRKGISVDTAALERMMGVPVVAINPAEGKGHPAAKKAVADMVGISRTVRTARNVHHDTSNPASNDFIDLQCSYRRLD